MQGSDNQTVRIIPTTGRTNCGGRCVLNVHVQDGKILKITTETEKDVNGTYPLQACPRGLLCQHTFLNEDRLKYPMKRVGKRGEGKFERISWSEAIDLLASEWIRIRDTYGPGSRYVIYGCGIDGLLRASSFAKRLLSLDGGYLSYYNSYSTGCIRPATELMYGTTDTGNDPREWLHSELIILWGHNPSETKFDSATMYYLKEARKKGTPIIIIDPRKSDTVMDLDAEWIPLRPATDAALSDAMAYVIYKNNLHDQAFLDRCCLGFDEDHMPDGVPENESYLSYLLGIKDGIEKTPEWGEQITGVPAETIRSLAIRYASAKTAALVQGYGAQRHNYGEQAIRGGITLACMTGNIGIKGGWAGGSADYNIHRQPSFPMPENPYKQSIPTYAWTDAVLRGTQMGEKDGVKGGDHLDSDIKMIFSMASNVLINQHGDINRTREILEDTSKCEFIVCSDIFMTASAKYADLVLPGISMLECENITVPWKYGEFIGYNNKIIDPLYEGKFEYEWFCQLADRLGLLKEFSEGRTEEQWLAYCYDALRVQEPELPELSVLKEKGLYRYQNSKGHIAFEKECQDPVHYPFQTPSGKIELFSKKVYEHTYSEEFPSLPCYIPVPEGYQDPLSQKYPLQLIGYHTKRRCHTVHDNNKLLQKLDPQALWINPADADRRGIKDGAEVFVYNDRGKVRIPAKVTDRIMKGVTALSQGAWYAPDQDGVDRGGCINVLTSHRLTPYAKGNPQHTNLVEVLPVNI